MGDQVFQDMILWETFLNQTKNFTYTHIYKCTCTYTFMHIHKALMTYALTHSCTYTHSCTLTNSHTCIDTHTHTQSQTSSHTVLCPHAFLLCLLLLTCDSSLTIGPAWWDVLVISPVVIYHSSDIFPCALSLIFSSNTGHLKTNSTM